MGSQHALIAPFKTGLDTDTEPWLSPADSFSIADNVHIYNGYIEKRSGFRLFANMKKLDTTVPIFGITQAVNGVVTTVGNHGLVNSDYVLINSVIGMTQVNGLYFIVSVLTPNTFQLNVDTSGYGAYAGGGTIAKVIDSTDRVMGIFQFIRASGIKDTLVFSTRIANLYNKPGEVFLPLDTAPIMNGVDTDFIWATNFQTANSPNRLFFTNGAPLSGGLNGIRYYDEISGNVTHSLAPALGGGRVLNGCKLIFGLKQRLIVLNTTENITNFPQRARWSQVQNTDIWQDLTPGGGGWVDAPTGDQIISGRALQDQIIVYFTNSVWSLRPRSDPLQPFEWIKLNDFRASDAKMGTVGYDRYVVSMGVRGITATDGVDTTRIDSKIKNFVFDEINVNEIEKIYAGRDFQQRRTWILYPPLEETENKRALVIDEESNGFTTYTIAMNCLGYGALVGDLTLADFITIYDLDKVIDDFDDETIQSYFWQGNEELFLGGDINGNVFILETGGSDETDSIGATLTTAGWNPSVTSGAQSMLNYLDIYVDTHERTIATVDFFKDDEESPYKSQTINFLPNLDFITSIQTVSQANPTIVNAADHGLVNGDTIFIYGVEGMIGVNGGPYTVTVIDTNFISINFDSSLLPAFTSGGALYRREFYKTKTWKRAYSGGTGYVHTVRISSEGKETPFRISALKPIFKQRGNRVVN